MKSINLQRTESLLLELIPEALSQLNDSRINSLPIVSVDCKNGKYDAKVYFDASDLEEDEISEVQKLLKKANGKLKSYCLHATSWYKCPDFHFVQDTTLEKMQHINKLFEQIEKGK